VVIAFIYTMAQPYIFHSSIIRRYWNFIHLSSLRSENFRGMLKDETRPLEVLEKLPEVEKASPAITIQQLDKAM